MYEDLMESYGIFEDENGELFIESEMVEYVMESYDLSEEDAIDVIMESYEEELEYISEECDADSERAMAQKRLVATAKPIAKGAVVGGTVLAAHKLYKKHKAKKAAKAMAEVKAKKRRLREDYGIFEEDGQLFIYTDEVYNVMESYNLSEEDAIDVIMESYEEELLYLENAAQEVVAASHHQVSVEADRQLRQAEMDEGDADRNLARGGKHILNGIRRAPRSEQDQAGEAGVRFKNRVDDGDMDGEFIDSGIQKPMGSGRRIAEDSDMGF